MTTGRNAEYAAWREQRQRIATVHAAAEEQRRVAEAAQARALIEEFVLAARARGLAPCRLTARGYDGARYRTALRGWYLRRDRTIAVGTDGAFYILTVPTSLRSRIAGVTPRPDQPRLVIGQGGRDGDSIPLDTLLRLRLDAGDAWS